MSDIGGRAIGRIGCVGIVRNEEAHIAEWLAWQFCAGFDTVFLLDNASTDATAAIARAMAPRLDVRVFDYPYRGADYQLRGYEQIARAAVADFEWLAFFDTDEFLRLDEGLNLKALLAQRPEAAVAVPWAMFGSNGHVEKPGGLVIESFTRRAEADFPPNRHVKSIVRPALMEAATNPHVFAMRGGYVDLSGRPVAWGHVAGLLAHDPDYAGGALNHYFTRSAAHWREKLARGYPDTSRAPEDFAAYDRNEVEDTRLAARAPALRALMAPPRHRYAICACARWETPYIVEWLSYYREIGFDHVYLYCNDDDPGPFYERVLPFSQGPAPFVTFHHHPHQGQQYEMYVHFAVHGMASCEFVSFFDIDEFLRLPPGIDIAAFMRRFPLEVECVLFNWVFFGANGHKAPLAGPVLEHYTRREAEIDPNTKFVARSRALAEVDFANRGRAHGFWHDFTAKLDRKLIVANVLGEDMAHYHKGFPVGAAEFCNIPTRRAALLATAVVHHYAFRSEQAYAQRLARGTKGDFQEQGIWQNLAEGPSFEFHLAKVNNTEDLSLASVWAQLRRKASGFTTGLAEHAVIPTRADNISRFKLATQSSHCSWSFAPTLEADAAGGVNGVLDGARHFHTDAEENPWWQVDLGAIATIAEIHVINTSDGMRGRFRDFALSVSIDGNSWVDVLEKRDGQVVEAPVVWAGPGTAWARYVRVTLLGRDFLHLNQVEVFGRF
jgi:glycosyltransferase involved in cell wall biosynthesis